MDIFFERIGEKEKEERDTDLRRIGTGQREDQKDTTGKRRVTGQREEQRDTNRVCREFRFEAKRSKTEAKFVSL